MSLPPLLVATVASRADSNCKEMKTTFFACHKIRQRRAGQVASLLSRCCNPSQAKQIACVFAAAKPSETRRCCANVDVAVAVDDAARNWVTNYFRAKCNRPQRGAGGRGRVR